MEKYAFKMQLHPGQEAEYRRRHDEIWPELVALLREAGVSDYSIHLDRETGTLFGVLWRSRRAPDGGAAGASGDAALVGAHGRHHGGRAGQRAGRGAARDRLSPGVTMAGHVGVIDIGKTNAKVALVDLGALREIGVLAMPNRVVPRRALSALRHRGGSGGSCWTGWAARPRARGSTLWSVTTHGACGGAARRGGRAGDAGARLRARRAGRAARPSMTRCGRASRRPARRGCRWG